jgi:hypothetical protein
LLAKTMLLPSFLHSKYLADLIQTVAGDGDAAVDWRVEAEIIISGVARGEHADTVQINNILPMTAYEGRRREPFSKIAQPLYGFIWFLPLGSDKRIIPLGFEIKNPIYLNQINRTVRTFHR